ncbi:MAG: hypothetical protein WC197_06665 [Candidatus Gastranaerophilaceae bacterium]|jgi:hypothetical protein
MTLIVATIMDNISYMICDKMHSIDSADDMPVNATLTTDTGMTINIKAPKIRINSGTKIYKIGKEEVLVGGAGNLQKVKQYIEFVKEKNTDIINETYSYYSLQKELAPDQLIILPQKNVGCYFTRLEDKEKIYNNFVNYRYELVENNIGVIAIGSGSAIFLNMYDKIRQELNKSYKEAIEQNKLEDWIEKLLSRFSEMYKDISKYDDGVGSEIEVYKL